MVSTAVKKMVSFRMTSFMHSPSVCKCSIENFTPSELRIASTVSFLYYAMFQDPLSVHYFFDFIHKKYNLRHGALENCKL